MDDFINMNFDHLNDDQKEIIRKLFGDEKIQYNLPIKKDDVLNNPGTFMQNLSDTESTNKFEELISTFNMTVDVNLTIQDDIQLIEEIWTSDDKSLRIKRYYEFNYDNISLLSNNVRTYIKEKLLSNALSEENYELASDIRDKIILD